MKTFYIDYFINQESFIDLQIDFLKQDHYYKMDSEVFGNLQREFRKEDFYIQEQVPSSSGKEPHGYSYEFNKVYFYKNYLGNIINQLTQNYLNDFYDYIREDLLESQRDRRKFLNEEKKRIATIIDNLDQFNFIDFRLFTELKGQLLQIEIAVNSPTLYNDKYIKLEKLALHNWNETDLVTFFNFLRTQKVIDFISDAELGRFLERNFSVENDNGEVTSFESLNKRLNDLKNVNKLNDRSEKRLTELFKKFSKY